MVEYDMPKKEETNVESGSAVPAVTPNADTTPQVPTQESVPEAQPSIVDTGVNTTPQPAPTSAPAQPQMATEQTAPAVPATPNVAPEQPSQTIGTQNVSGQAQVATPQNANPVVQEQPAQTQTTEPAPVVTDTPPSQPESPDNKPQQQL